MKIVILDGSKIKNVSDLHDTFSESLGFPAYYGRNLDALYDLLSETGEEITILSVGTDALEKTLGKKWSAFLRMMDDLENGNIKFISDSFD